MFSKRLLDRKVNDGKDITEDMLPDDIEQENIIDMFFNRFIHRK